MSFNMSLGFLLLKSVFIQVMDPSKYIPGWKNHAPQVNVNGSGKQSKLPVLSYHTPSLFSVQAPVP